MSKTFLVALCSLFFLLPGKPLYSITKKGDLEFSTSASFTNTRSDGGNNLFFVLPIRVGTFLRDQMEFEVEGLLSSMLTESGDPALLYSGLLSYHFLNTSTQNPSAKFILCGFGVTNTVPVSLSYSGGRRGDYAPVLNLGAGIKQFLADPVAIRIEYRYQKYMGDIDQSNHMFLVGLSVFKGQ